MSKACLFFMKMTLVSKRSIEMLRLWHLILLLVTYSVENVVTVKNTNNLGVTVNVLIVAGLHACRNITGLGNWAVESNFSRPTKVVTRN